MTQPTVSSQSRTAGGLKSEHYPSLELCDKLKLAGFPEGERYYDTGGEYGKVYTVYPSIAELLDELPMDIDFLGENRGLRIMYVEEDKAWEVGYLIDSTGKVEYGTLPNALAEMWLWLKENNLLPNGQRNTPYPRRTQEAS